jgi:hypothetical protein
MKSSVIILAVAVGLIGCESSSGAQPVRLVRETPLKGKLAHAKELSGAALWGNFLIACSDEGAELNVLSAATYRLVDKPRLLQDEDDEVDMEGAASDGQHVYVVGSHSMRRLESDNDRFERRRRERLSQTKPHEDSYSLFRLTLDDRGRIDSSERISLRDLLENDKTLGPYTKIPGKENGVDIEGIAVKDGWLLVGFRGPVLPGNLAPVMCFEFDRPEAYLLKLLKLDGRGIRDMMAVQDGFLILTGPVGEEDGVYQLYHWSGSDFGTRAQPLDGNLTQLGEVSGNGKSKPEGIAPIAETDREWTVLLLCDGDAKARELRVAKPR